MKSRSAKNKGVRLQNQTVQDLYEAFEGLREGDIKPAVMGESGIDIILSPHAQDTIPLDIECKNQERLNIWDAMKQAETNSDGRIPCTVFKRNRSETYACVKWSDLLKILSD